MIRAQRGAAAAAVALFLCTGGLGAAELGQEKTALCATCHGPNGNSTNPAIPSLAGQPRDFIANQLIWFREGRRKDPQMSPIAASLAPADIRAFGAYFAAQTPVASAPELDQAKASAGRELAQKYNCVQCHGPDLKGVQHIPRLVSQQRDYLRTQLRGFKAGTRFDMDGNMTSAAQPLTEADIDLLAEYLSSSK